MTAGISEWPRQGADGSAPPAAGTADAGERDMDAVI